MSDNIKSIFNKLKVDWVRKNQNLLVGSNDFKVEIVNIDTNNDLFVRQVGKVQETKVLYKNLENYHLGGYETKNKKTGKSASASDDAKYIKVLSDHLKEMQARIARAAAMALYNEEVANRAEGRISPEPEVQSEEAVVEEAASSESTSN